MHEISTSGLLVGYLLLAIPLVILLWFRVPMIPSVLWAVVRMTVQLLLVGFYLRFVFELNHLAINLAWLFIMIAVADGTALSRSGLTVRRMGTALFVAVSVGTLIPVLIFTGGILRLDSQFEAQYLIPISGMVLGNCLRADIIGLRAFYGAIRTNRSACQLCLAEGATLHEMTRPWLRDALEAALSPTVATMATIGLVALPGMMTGVILAGADPMTAVIYQIAIMIAIFSGTALTVLLAILLSLRSSFDPYGNLDERIFR